MKKYACLFAFAFIACSSPNEERLTDPINQNPTDTTAVDTTAIDTIHVIVTPVDDVAVTTTQSRGVLLNSATIGGGITITGQPNVTEYGIVYATTQDPTVADTKIVNNTGLSTFDFRVENLQSNTTYYYRAFATDAVTTKYGETLSLTTQSLITPSCDLVENALTLTSFDNTVDYQTGTSVYLNGNSQFVLGSTHTAYTATITFNEINNALPATGMYLLNYNTQTESKSSGYAKMSVDIILPPLASNYDVIDFPNGTLYVENNNNGTITFTVCNVITQLYRFNVSTKFIYHQ